MLNAAFHGGASIGLNFSQVGVRVPFELRGVGYRFFIKKFNGWFIDPILKYETKFTDLGTIVVPEFRVGKVTKIASKKASFFVAPRIMTCGLGLIFGIGGGCEWNYSPYMSFLGHVDIDNGGGSIKVGIEFHEADYYNA